MIRFLLNIWNLLEKHTFREILTVSSILLFFLFINFFATTNLFYSSRGIVKYNEISSEINLNIKEYTKPITIPGGFLIIMLNDKKVQKVNINFKEEYDKRIAKEKNTQLSQFSEIYFKKIKKNSTISEK